MARADALDAAIFDGGAGARCADVVVDRRTLRHDSAERRSFEHPGTSPALRDPEAPMTRISSSVMAICLAAALPACTDDGDPDGATVWESAETTTDDGAIVIQKVAYRSGELRIVGQVCRPAGAGPFPLRVVNHGGVWGLPAWNGGACAEAARAGSVYIESAFRGQDGSEGGIELCLGEVDDALRMLELALELPEVDGSRVTMWGAELGGCITARAVQRGAPVQAAASVFGIADLAKAHGHWLKERDTSEAPAWQYQALLLAAEEAIGSGPSTRPQEYARRSPVSFAADTPMRVPFLIAHGSADPIVPARQSCDLAQRLGMEGHHLDSQHEPDGATPTGCEAMWRQSADPIEGWPLSRYLLVYGGLGHTIHGPEAAPMRADLESFLAAKIR